MYLRLGKQNEQLCSSLMQPSLQFSTMGYIKITLDDHILFPRKYVLTVVSGDCTASKVLTAGLYVPKVKAWHGEPQQVWLRISVSWLAFGSLFT